MESSQSRELSKGLFIGPRRKLDRSAPDGDSSAWQTHRRAEPGERLGTGSGASILVEQWLAPAAGWSLQWQKGRSLLHTHTHIHTHSATLLLRSKRRLEGRAALEKLPLSGCLSCEWEP